MTDSYPRSFNWYAPRATVALLAGIAAAAGVSQLNTGDSRRVNHIDGCATASANLVSPGATGPFAHVLSAHEIRVGDDIEDMSAADPACASAPIERFTDVVVSQAGQVLGTISLLTPDNDHGGMHTDTLTTGVALGCNMPETVTFDTIAGSGETGVQVETKQIHTFTTQCTSN